MGKYDVAPTVAAGLIRLARDKAGLTQTELAGRAGVSQQAISAYETGRKEPTLALPPAPRRRRGVRAEGPDSSRSTTTISTVEAFLASLPVGSPGLRWRSRDVVRVEEARLRRI